MIKEINSLFLNSNIPKLTHVFFVVNPVTVLITRMIIDQFDLKTNKILIISNRNTDLSILDFNSLYILPSRINNLYDKLFFSSFIGKKVLKKLKGSQFIIYASWATRELSFLMNSRNCKGHFYIEEGQGSYMNHIPFSYTKVSLIDKLKNNFKNRLNEDDSSGYFYRDDSLGFIGISNKAFPKINESKKTILNNLNSLKVYYKPKLIGIKTIGLTCAERRLEDNNWRNMLKIIVDKLPENSAIKAHPSFTFSQQRFNKLKKMLEEISNKNIRLLENDVILELEMLYEKKKFIGPQTSVSIYAEFFDSTFENLKLY